MANLYSPGYTLGAKTIAKSDIEFKKGDLLTIKAGVLDKAVAGDKIEGISLSNKSFGANNLQEFEYCRLGDETILEIEVENGTLASADVGENFDLNANGNVDGATKGSGTQLTLKQVLGETKGLFYRAK